VKAGVTNCKFTEFVVNCNLLHEKIEYFMISIVVLLELCDISFCASIINVRIA
jgi:hypothetical protein